MKKILIISIFILFLAGCSFGDKKVENQEIQQKSEDIISEIKNTPVVETSEISNTEVIHYMPPEILPKKILDGYCWTSSLATKRTDAWRCMNDNSILDPCFNLPQSEKIICPNNPADKNDDLLLNLTKPLPKPDPQLNEFQSGEYVWYIELQNGSYCLPIIGASAFVGNDRANFLCESEEYIMGKINAGLVWTAKKAILSPVDQQSGDFTIKSSEEVSIKKVWE